MSLAVSMPRFLGAVLVNPTLSRDMVSDEEIEKRGMEVAMNYEGTQGREPEDVSKENVGFDIRSKSRKEIRYIEVKSRKGKGDVALTCNEWFKAKRFKEQYWLYVITNPHANPELYIINDPAGNINVRERVEVVRFIVPVREWKNKGIRA